MKKIKISLMLIVIAMLSFACSFGKNSNAESTAPENSPAEVSEEVNESAAEEAVPEAAYVLPGGYYMFTNRNKIEDLAELDGRIYAATLGGLAIWQRDTGTLLDVVPTTGMGHVSANAVVACNIPEPRILVGTMQGLRIYNPAADQWELKELLPADNKVSTSKIERLFCDQENQRLLVGYNGLGILDLDTGSFEQYTDQNGLAGNMVTDITVSEEEIWVASGYYGISRISNGDAAAYNVVKGMPDEKAYALAMSADGTLWVGGNSGLMTFKNGIWKLLDGEGAKSLTNINEIDIASAESLWIAASPNGAGKLCLFNTATLTCDQLYDEPDRYAIFAMTTPENGLPVIGTNYDISVLENNGLNPLKTDDILLDNNVDTLVMDALGNLWIGTEYGIQVLDLQNPLENWTTYKRSEQTDMGGSFAQDIAFAPDGSAWIAFQSGNASSFQNNQWQLYKDIFSYNTVAIDAQNRIWYGDDSKGIIVMDASGNQLMTFDADNGLPGNNIQALLPDHDGTMWVGTNKGLAKYAGESMSIVFDASSTELPNANIKTLALQDDGSLLIGTYTGVAQYDGQTAVTLVDFIDAGYPTAHLTAAAWDSTGTLWIGTDKGLIHGDPQSGWTVMTTDDGLLTNAINALVVDEFDNIWVGGGSSFDGGGLLLIVP